MTEADLGQALQDTADWLARGRAPTRQHVRPLLIGLGQALLEGRASEVEPALGTVLRWIEADPGCWRDAVGSEVSMAVTEHVRSIDPRYLDHPKFDFVYVVDARHRLEARLRAAEALGLAADDALLEAVERADALLGPHLRNERSGGRGNGTP